MSGNLFRNMSIYQFSEEVCSLFAKIGEQVRIVYDRLPTDINVLPRYGWYPMFAMLPSDPLQLVRKLKAGDHLAVEEFMDDLISKNLAEIERLAVNRYPERECILREAFQAHRENRYYLSIPVFLTQSEGICFEQTNLKLFSNRDNKSVLNKFVKNLEEQGIIDILCQAIASPSCFNVPESLRGEFSFGPNRHEILHGININYGIRSNSIRAISLLNFIIEILYEGSEKVDSTTIKF